MRKTLVPWLVFAGGAAAVAASVAFSVNLAVPPATAAPPAAAQAAPAANPAVQAPVAVAAKPVAPAGPSVERRLHLASAEASSFLWDDFNKFQQNYHPLYIGDDDPKTAWVEGVKGHGEGEWLRLKYTQLEGASKVRVLIRNGYQKTDRLFTLNSRLKEVTLKLLPGGETIKTTLKDDKGFQEVVMNQPAGPFDGVELRVGSVYPGSKWDDLTVSDIQVFVTATTRENPAYEKARLEKLLKWKQERASMAAAFKDTVKQQMPLLPQYTLSAADVQNADTKNLPVSAACKKERYGVLCSVSQVMEIASRNKVGNPDSLALAKKLAEGNFAEMQKVRLALVDKRPFPTTDGLCVHDLNFCNEGCYDGIELPQVSAIGFLATSGFNTFEDKAIPDLESALAATPRSCRAADKGLAYHYAYRQKNAEGRDTVRALFLVRCGGVESREGMDSVAYGQLLVYNEQGQLDLLVARDSVTEFGFTERGGQKVLTAARQVERGTLRTLAEPAKVATK